MMKIGPNAKMQISSMYIGSLELMLCVIDISTLNKTYLIWRDLLAVYQNIMFVNNSYILYDAFICNQISNQISFI